MPAARTREGRQSLHAHDRNQVLQIPSCASEVHRVQCLIQQAMEQHGYDDDACFAVKLSVEESIINAIRHGNKFDRSRCVEIRFDVSDECVRIHVRDEGKGFNPCCVPDPTSEENLPKPHGRGIMLMRAYMDEVYYADDGREVTMVKRKRADG